LRRDNNKLRKQVAKLESTLKRRNEQLRILEDLATELQRDMAKLRAGQSVAPSEPTSTPVVQTSEKPQG
jgi:prefoldin subunit 5